MNQPIPRNGTGPLKVGDRVQIVPEGKTRATINTNASSSKPHPTPPNTTQVRIQAQVPGLFFQPTEWIEANRLNLHPEN
jgi:hypothetical protein